MTDKIKLERLKKIRALALMGVPGGEREAAQALLDKLMKKYDVSISELKEEEVKEYIFEYHGTEQEQLLYQIIYKVTNTPGPVFFVINNSGHKCRTKFGAYCTAAQNIEIRFLFDFYSSLWEQEKKSLLFAFIQKHRLFGELKEGDEPSEISEEELKKMYAMMRGLSNASPRKALKEGKV